MEEDTESLLGSVEEQYFDERRPFDTYRSRHSRYLPLKTYNEDEEYEQVNEESEPQNDNTSDRSNGSVTFSGTQNNLVVVPETTQHSQPEHSIIDLA